MLSTFYQQKRMCIIIVLFCLTHVVCTQRVVDTFNEILRINMSHLDRSCYCTINVRALKRNHPLLLDPRTGSVFHPNMNSIISLESNQDIVFHCPLSQLRIKKKFNVTFGAGKCIWNNTYVLEHEMVHLSDLRCTQPIKAIEIDTGIYCPPRGTYINIGYQLHDGTFVKQYMLCYDKALHTIYSSHHVMARNVRLQYPINSERFIESPLSELPVPYHTMFSTSHQRMIINELAGYEEKSTSFVNRMVYLRPYSVIPKYDFAYKYERLATLKYINVIPLWTTLSRHNWQIIEFMIRSYSVNNNVELTIFCGTFGTMQLRHKSYNAFRRVFLYYNTTTLAVPVPLQIWKVVYDPINKKGVVVIGLNDPFNGNVTRVQLCPDISPLMGPHWPVTTNKTDNYFNGFIYVCEIATFRSRLKMLPFFEVNSILKFPL